MGVRYQKYRSIAIPLNIGIELSQVSRYFDIFGIEPALSVIQCYRVIRPSTCTSRVGGSDLCGKDPSKASDVLH